MLFLSTTRYGLDYNPASLKPAIYHLIDYCRKMVFCSIIIIEPVPGSCSNQDINCYYNRIRTGFWFNAIFIGFCFTRITVWVGLKSQYLQFNLSVPDSVSMQYALDYSSCK